MVASNVRPILTTPCPRQRFYGWMLKLTLLTRLPLDRRVLYILPVLAV
jgi:hypothetical protein